MTQEDEKIETCRVAMKAALEAIQDYCGAGEPEGDNCIKFAGEVIEYPYSMHDIMDNPELSGDEKAEEIAGTAWAERIAREQCEGVSDPVTPSEVDTCVKRLRSTLANEVVFQRLKWAKKE